jgi:hypothetical protein
LRAKTRQGGGVPAEHGKHFRPGMAAIFRDVPVWPISIASNGSSHATAAAPKPCWSGAGLWLHSAVVMEVRSVEAMVRALNGAGVKHLGVGGLAVNAHRGQNCWPVEFAAG